MNITQLNDDDLLEILSWVNVFDGINFISSCKRMEGLSDLYCKKFSNFDFTKLEKKMSLKELNQLFQLIGKSLKKLDMSKIKLTFIDGNAIVKVLTKHCKKLQELNMLLPYFAMLKQPLPGGLKSLSIFSFDFENDAMAAQLLMSSWKSLQTFRIFDIPKLNGAFLDKIENLQELQIENCQAMIQNNLINCFLQNKTLRKLTIRSCPQISENIIPKLCKLLPDLQVLRLDVFSKSGKPHRGLLINLENLRVLDISLYRADATLFVNSLISTMSPNACLQELHIERTANLTPESIRHLLAMKSLRKLNFLECLFVDREFCLMIGEALPLADVSFIKIKSLNSDALLAFAVRTRTLERLHVMLCPVTLEVKTQIAEIIHQDVSNGNRPNLIIDIQRIVE